MQITFAKNDALRMEISRSNETLETKQARLKKQREYQVAYYENQSGEERASRLGDKLEYQQSFRDNQNYIERASRLERQLENQKAYYLSENSEELIILRKSRLDYQKAHFEEQSNERRTARLDYQRKYKSLRTKGNNDTYLNIARSVLAFEFNDSLISENSFGAMEFICPLCDAKFWESEKLTTSTKSCYKFSLCCGQGKVVLPPLASPPEMLMHLLTTADKRGKAFRDQIRAYNSALAFASLGVNLDKELANARRGVYTFRIQGVVHHYIGQLTPREGEAPSFAQIYIHDGTAEGEIENRLRRLGEASLPELKELQALMHVVNPYVQYFKHGIELMRA